MRRARVADGPEGCETALLASAQFTRHSSSKDWTAQLTMSKPPLGWLKGEGE
jgi:3-oxoacyl-ACP reductase-like protein